MRLRHIQNGKEILKNHPKVITQPENYKRKLQEIFNNDNEVHVELGSGKGDFIRQMSLLNPNINYFGFERNTKVIFKWLNKIEDNCTGNYYIVHSNANMILDIFEKNSIERIYLNFSDPWPKPRHHRRRLTDKVFLDLYKIILKKNGQIHIKTDNKDLYKFSKDQLIQNDWKLINIIEDLHNSEFAIDNVKTEYERKFVAEGKKIHKIVASL